MTIIYPLTMPLTEFADITFIERNIQSVSTSRFTGARQVQIFQGEFWEANISWPELDFDDAEPITAFLSSLRGYGGSFLLPDPINKVPRGEAKTSPGSPVVDGAGQTGSGVLIRGAPASIAGWLISGDRIQIGPNERARIHKVLTTVDTDAAGKAVIDIWPRIRTSTVDGDNVSLFDPVGLFAMATPDTGYSITPPYRYGIAITAREAF